MTYAGARGDTEKQMRQVLHLESDQRKVHSDFGELQRQLGKAGEQKGIELNVANALWAQKGHPFLPAFLDIAKANYQANINQADFVIESEKVRDEIDRWVAQKTKDRIQNILPPGSLTDLTRLVLANPIYFKGVWAEPFDKDETASQPFHLSGDRNRNVPLMHHFDSVKYMDDGEFQAVELPYHGGELSMVVLLPRRIDGCGQLEARLTPALISQSLGQMKQQRVEVFLPRFKLEFGIDLNEALANLGMPNAFGPKSDFSGMDGLKWLYISGVYHKAWGEVNQEGTEAAASTAVAVAGRAISKPPPPLRCSVRIIPLSFSFATRAPVAFCFSAGLQNPANTKSLSAHCLFGRTPPLFLYSGEHRRSRRVDSGIRGQSVMRPRSTQGWSR